MYYPGQKTLNIWQWFARSIKYQILLSENKKTNSIFNSSRIILLQMTVTYKWYLFYLENKDKRFLDSFQRYN